MGLLQFLPCLWRPQAAFPPLAFAANVLVVNRRMRVYEKLIFEIAQDTQVKTMEVEVFVNRGCCWPGWPSGWTKQSAQKDENAEVLLLTSIKRTG